MFPLIGSSKGLMLICIAPLVQAVHLLPLHKVEALGTNQRKVNPLPLCGGRD